ncbi:MAG: hypothetical protein WKF36_05080 [Candidatus Nitrosocosmicus sp.]
MVKTVKFCFESKNLLLILILLIIPVINNVNANNIFSQNPSNTSFNDNSPSKEFRELNPSPANPQLNYSDRNFFYLKSGDLSIPINFFASEKNIVNNAIYDTDKNALTLMLNPLVFNYSTLVIQIPREILDSKTPENKDSNFTVLADGKPSKFSEIQPKEESETNSNSSATTTTSTTTTTTTKNSTISSFFDDIPNRKLLIEFDKDTKVIEITGNDRTEKNADVQTYKDKKENTPKIFPVSIENETSNIKFNVIGGDLRNINLLEEKQNKNKTLELMILPFSRDGNIVIQIPREILDSKTPENKDSNFTVLADGKPSKFSEIQPKEESETNSNSSATTTTSTTTTTTTKNSTISSFFDDIPNRKLLIEFDKDTKVIEITGNDQTANQTANQDVESAFMLTALLLILSVSLASIYTLYKGGRLKSLGKIIYRLYKREQKK